MSVAIRTPDQIELEALRAEVSMLLEHCTEKQTAFFNKLYPSGVTGMDREKLRNAVCLCQRTIRQNVTGDMHGALPVTSPVRDKYCGRAGGNCQCASIEECPREFAQLNQE